jgi:hypothetical protein
MECVGKEFFGGRMAVLFGRATYRQAVFKACVLLYSTLLDSHKMRCST